jgi:hypothetical protein
MEIEGTVNIEIDQYADVNIEIDTDDLAEILCQNHDLVDDVVLREYVREHVTGMVQDEVAKLEPNNQADSALRAIIREEIAATLSAAISHTNRDMITMSEWARREKGMIDGR